MAYSVDVFSYFFDCKFCGNYDRFTWCDLRTESHHCIPHTEWWIYLLCLAVVVNFLCLFYSYSRVRLLKDHFHNVQRSDQPTSPFTPDTGRVSPKYHSFVVIVYEKMYSSLHAFGHDCIGRYWALQPNPFGSCWWCSALCALGWCGVHWVQCSEAAILAEWVQWVQCCWRLVGWIRWQCQIADINHQPPLLPPLLSAVSPFLSPLLSSVLGYITCRVTPLIARLTLSLYVFLCTALCSRSVSQTHKQIEGSSRQCRHCYEWHPLAHPEEVYAPVWLYKPSPLS